MAIKRITHPKWANKKLYDGKFFYEIVRTIGRLHLPGGAAESLAVELVGPYDNILYMKSPSNGFAQVIGGEIVQVFQPHEILVTDHKL